MREESSSTIFSPIGTLLGPVPWPDAFTDSPESTSNRPSFWRLLNPERQSRT
jgi:hypothetical protein